MAAVEKPDLDTLFANLSTTLTSLSGDHGDFPLFQQASSTLSQIRLRLSNTMSLQHEQTDGNHRCLRVLIDCLLLLSSHSAPHDTHFFDLLRVLFAVLAQIMSSTSDNDRFSSPISDNEDLTDVDCAISLIGDTLTTSNAAQAKLFGILFDFALNGTLMQAELSKSRNPSLEASSSYLGGLVADFITQSKATGRHLSHPRLCCSIFTLRTRLYAGEVANPVDIDGISLCVLKALRDIANTTQSIACDLQDVGLLDAAASVLLTIPMDSVQQSFLTELMKPLLCFGFRNLNTVSQLLQASPDSEVVSEVLLNAIKLSQGPPAIQFTLLPTGSAGIELAELQAFPPVVKGGGYTFATWFYIEELDSTCHTTIFGAFDAKHGCFLLIYLDRASHQLVLRVSINDLTSVARFSSVTFTKKQWYHVAVTHEYPSNRASLIVNGRLCERQTCTYPCVVTSERSQISPVKAFIGTPLDMSPHPGSGNLRTNWSFASMHIFSMIISEELLAVIYHLGANYHGNFQDSLGSFLTYPASAALSLQTNSIHSHPGEENTSKIDSVIRGKAGRMIPESSIVMSLAAASTPDAATKRPATTLRPLSAMNVSGHTTILAPRSVAADVFRLTGGVTSSLDMVAKASTFTALVRAVDIFFEILSPWRNSEAMEREEGFSILKWLLEVKFCVTHTTSDHQVAKITDFGQSRLLDLDESTVQILDIILHFLGVKDAQQSIIVNPLAYRTLIIDCDLWQLAGQKTRTRFFNQFVVLGVNSKYSLFNVKRMNRLRVIRRLLDGFKFAPLVNAAAPIAMEALFKILAADGSASMEGLRCIALSITQSLAEYERRELFAPDVDREKTDPSLTVTMLISFVNFLCEEENKKALKRFAKAVTVKWTLDLLTSVNRHVVASAAKLLCRLLLVANSTYLEHFTEHKGFVIMRYRLEHWGNDQDVWTVCASAFLGIPMPANAPLGVFSCEAVDLAVRAADEGRSKLAMWPVMAAMIRKGLSTIELQNAAGSDEATHRAIPFLRILRAVHSRSAAFRLITSDASFGKEVLDLLFVHTTDHTPSLDEVVPPLQQSQPDPQNGSTPGSGLPLRQTSIIRPSIGLKSVRRNSSYIIVPMSDGLTNFAEFILPLAPVEKAGSVPFQPSGAVAEILANIQTFLVHLCADQIFSCKDFSGLGLYLKAPSTSANDLTRTMSSITRELLTYLGETLSKEPSIFLETQSLINLSRFFLQTSEAIFEGWLAGVSLTLLRIISDLLCYLGQPDIKTLKSVRLCEPFLSSARTTSRRLIILQLSNLEELVGEEVQEDFILSLITWQDIFISREEPILGSLCWLLLQIVGTQRNEKVGRAALILLQQFARQHSEEFQGFMCLSLSRDPILIEMVDRLQSGQEGTIIWIQQNYLHLRTVAAPGCGTIFRRFATEENAYFAKSSVSRARRRVSRIEQSRLSHSVEEKQWSDIEKAASAWAKSVYASETRRFNRSRQDAEDNDQFISRQFGRLMNKASALKRLRLPVSRSECSLDEAEGMDRLRVRLVFSPDITRQQDSSIPRRRGSKTVGRRKTNNSTSQTREQVRPLPHDNHTYRPESPDVRAAQEKDVEDYEVVEKQKTPAEESSDISRKILRSLKHGERALQVHNISRIRGLEAVEGVIIIAKDNVYIIPNLLRRSNGEIVNVWEVQEQERDAYHRIISGHQTDDHSLTQAENSVQSWLWVDIVSISKRQFLFRDVALEIFFRDGRSLLLTTASQLKTNELYANLMNRIAAIQTALSEVSNWKKHDDPQTVGERLASVMNISTKPAATTRWLRGEMSNFSYLMTLNSLSGRSFNDLSQYPVFPWILRDYTSSELNLGDQNVYRDLTKPMGCQTPQRQEAFKDRYSALESMSEQNKASWNYGTHYSAAMIVSSYLVRLQPFLKSYLLLQGGCFDQPGRLFQSMHRTWLNASQDSMADVRELIPEFFFLPEFLEENDDFKDILPRVQLPPWAHEDPSLFVHLNREALESSYVTKNLHNWIDLIFGYKQRGDAAIEAVNVFHHLSYQQNLDHIEDPQEKIAAIQTVHNFGQTPRQIFAKPHPKRQVSEPLAPKTREEFHLLGFFGRKGKDAGQDLLQTKSSGTTTSSAGVEPPLLQSASSLSSNRLQVPNSNKDVYVRWDHLDGSLRFYSRDDQVLGVFEQLHHSHITTAIFADAETLVTASDDCTISIWKMIFEENEYDLEIQGRLHGHVQSVRFLALSKALRTLVSSDSENRVFTWDLNTHLPMQSFKCPSDITHLVINDYNGHVLTACNTRLILHSTNARHLLDQDVGAYTKHSIVSWSFACHENPGESFRDRLLGVLSDGSSVSFVIDFDPPRRWYFRPEDGSV